MDQRNPFTKPVEFIKWFGRFIFILFKFCSGTIPSSGGADEKYMFFLLRWVLSLKRDCPKPQSSNIWIANTGVIWYNKNSQILYE